MMGFMIQKKILPRSQNKSTFTVVLSPSILSLTKFIWNITNIYDINSITRYTIKYIFIIYLIGVINVINLQYKVSQIQNSLI